MNSKDQVSIVLLVVYGITPIIAGLFAGRGIATSYNHERVLCAIGSCTMALVAALILTAISP